VDLISGARILVAISFLAFAAGTSRAASQQSTAVPPVTDVLVSRQLAARAHLAVGDTVTLAADPAGTRAVRFRVAGVYEPTPDPLRFNVERLEVRMHLDELAGIVADPADGSSTDILSAVNVRLADQASTKFSRALSARAPFVVASQPGGSESATFVVIDRFHEAIAVVTVIGSTAFLLALMVIRAEERKETVGVLRLIGISRKTILTEVVVEGLVVAIAGAIFGVAFAWLAQRGVNQFFQARYDTTLVFMRITPAIALRSIAVASWLLLRRGTTALVRR
jgi:ABC-type antimicrobial peptide transport system permease subunit